MRRPGLLVAALAAVALAGCQELALAPPDAPATAPPDRAAPPPEPAPDPSAELERYYSRVEAGLVGRGLLRTDGGGVDAPFTADDLARNFEQIALFEEYATIGGRLVARKTESRIHRWEEPIRLQVTIGPGVTPAKANRDRAAISRYARRLARVTGHPISEVERDGNFHIFIVTEAERRALGPRLTEIVPGIGRAALDTVTDLPRSSYCLVFASDSARTNAYETAVAIIRAEHPDLLRLSCIHEEIAQGMGLSNDSPAARPSVFNDDEEFGLLTYHDELLLKMLYDPRLSPGMDLQAARPIAAAIARELVGGES